MARYKVSEIIRRANTKEDRANTDRIYYAAGEQIGSEELKVYDRGIIAQSDLGPMFYYGFKSGQLLLPSRSFESKKAAIATYDGICSEKTFVLESADTSVLLNDYLVFVFQNEDFWQFAEENKSGSVNFFLNWSTIAEYEFDLPPIEEQKLRAEKLWAAYEVKQSYLKMIKATREMVQSQFIEMFKDKQPNGKIGDLVNMNIMSVKKTYNADDAIEYIDISSIDSLSRSVSETTNYVVKSAPSRAQQCVGFGDILVSTVRPINRNIAVVTTKSQNLVASTGFCVLRPKEGYREYLLSVVLSDKYTQKMCDKASGGLYPAINNGDVLSYEVFIPDKEMLTKISTIYHQADKSEFGGSKSQFIENFEFCELNLNTPSNDFDDLCYDDTASCTKIPAGKYLPSGKYAIYDQSQDNVVAGYTDEEQGLCNNYPAVLFGDHSRVIKYIDEPFFIGADGVKIIRPKTDDILPEFLFYDLKYHAIPNTGYNRHFKYIKMLKLTKATMDEQNKFLDFAHQADKSEYVTQGAIVSIDKVNKSYIN